MNTRDRVYPNMALLSTSTKLNIYLSLRVKRSVTTQSQGFELNQIDSQVYKYFCRSTYPKMAVIQNLCTQRVKYPLYLQHL
jgi:hypothetical protein